MQLIIEEEHKYNSTLIDYWKAFGVYTREKWTYECPKNVQYIDIKEYNR